MNEWSPGTNYSRPGTPNQSGRSFRSQWDDNEKGTKPLIVNIRAVSEKSKPQQQQQHSLEDVTKSSLSVTSKSKKNGADGSDPRFKRVISNGFQNDACVGTEIRPPKKGVQVKEDAKSKLSHWIPSGNGNSDQGVNEVKVESKESLRPEEAKRKPPGKVEPVSCSYLSQDLKEVTKSAFNHDVVKIASKESLSNCTVNTLNTSLTSDDLVDDVPNEIDIFPSASRVKKVHNWMLDQKPKVEKKQSLITVIGQTQGRDTVSSALREIDKRRKLVKELDKYAMCKKIIETEKGKDVSEMVAKITAVSSEEDSNNHSSCKNGNGSGDTAGNHKEVNGMKLVI
ncbi:hypothetical protein RUM43_014633 [Polyplax serrata]|uniref:Uncharacterized protein n=1 Tax=Polyplax serrata TaxID=468196 RepID=A0AAN8PGD8_POLSC